MGPGWFAMAVHALALLARSAEGYPSTSIAGSVNTHAAFLRRVLSRLVRAGLVEAREGRDGGYRLARPADRITLADVYRAVAAPGPIALSPVEPNPACPVGAGMRATLGEVTGEVQERLLQVLAQHTIAEVSDRAVYLGQKR